MLSIDEKVRVPITGLRVKLRNQLRSLGYEHKMQISHHRRYGLVVTGIGPFPEIEEFEGYVVKFIEKKSVHKIED